MKPIKFIILFLLISIRIHAERPYIDMRFANGEYIIESSTQATFSYEVQIRAGAGYYEITGETGGFSGFNLNTLLYPDVADMVIDGNSTTEFAPASGGATVVSYDVFGITYYDCRSFFPDYLVSLMYDKAPEDVVGVQEFGVYRDRELKKDLTEEFISIGRVTHIIAPGPVTKELPTKICIMEYTYDYERENAAQAYVMSGFSYEMLDDEGIIRNYGNGLFNLIYPAEGDRWCLPCPPISVWIGGTSDNEQDWHTATNWYPESVPQSCTDVYIPGISVTGASPYYFPTLSGDAGDGEGWNTCDRIFFMPGAQLGRPDLLSYTEAHVQIDYNTLGYSSLFAPDQLDYEALVAIGRDYIDSQDRVQFGALYSGTTMHRGYWNMFSAPLKEITTGDFAFGGFPFSYIKQYDATVDNETSYIKGNWADMINDSKTAFDPGQGFGHYFYPYINKTPYGMDDSKESTQWNNVAGVTAATPKHIKAEEDSQDNTPFGLAHSNGILHFPYYADEYLSDARRAHEFTPESEGSKAGTSKFHFFWRSPLTSANFMQWDGTVETVDRTAASHRFIFEGWSNNTRSIAGTFAAGDIVLVGNPYMSALDFDAFQTANDAKIKKVYHVYDNGTTYITYGAEATGVNTTDKFIAPMQSFLVEVKESTDDLQLVFNPEEMAGTSTTTMLKSSRPATDNRLTITASNATGEVSTWVRQSGDADDAFCGEDFSKIIDAANATPQVYTLAPTEDGKARALLLNSIRSNQTVVPIGLATTHSGDVTLTVSGMNNYEAKVYFEDSASDYRVEITGEEEFAYNFIHDGNTTEGRFSLSFAPNNTTGLDSNDFATQARAYVNGSDLIVLSSGDNLITAIEVYDLQSRLLSTQAVPASSQYKLNNVLIANGAYIIKVYGEKGVSSIKVIR